MDTPNEGKNPDIFDCISVCLFEHRCYLVTIITPHPHHPTHKHYQYAHIMILLMFYLSTYRSPLPITSIVDWTWLRLFALYLALFYGVVTFKTPSVLLLSASDGMPTSLQGTEAHADAAAVEGDEDDDDDEEELRTVIINVSGVRHEMSTRTLRDLPPTARLANLDTVQRHYRWG